MHSQRLCLPWYLPSFYGDIKLETTGSGKTVLVYEGLSPTECLAMKTLRKRAMGGLGRTRWCLPQEFREDFGADSSGTILLQAKIEEVQALLSKALKPGRSLVTAVRFSDGSVEEKASELGDYRVNAQKLGDDDKPKEEPKKEEKKPEKEPKAAVTVAAPERGCPPPSFDEAEVRASRVLEVFLSPEQIEDFRTRQQFVVVGADSGHRYLLTSRHAPRALARGGGRSLYDLDEEIPMCVHDWDVPAAEELLALRCFLALPGREEYIRCLPE